MSYKIGDRILCLETAPSNFLKGKFYIIVEETYDKEVWVVCNEFGENKRVNVESYFETNIEKRNRIIKDFL